MTPEKGKAVLAGEAAAAAGDGERKRRKRQRHVCQDKELAPAPPWGPGSRCGLTNWIFKLKWPAKCQTGLATDLPDTQGQRERFTEKQHVPFFPSPAWQNPALQSRCVSFSRLSPLFDETGLNNVHFATSGLKREELAVVVSDSTCPAATLPLL